MLFDVNWLLFIINFDGLLSPLVILIVSEKFVVLLMLTVKYNNSPLSNFTVLPNKFVVIGIANISYIRDGLRIKLPSEIFFPLAVTKIVLTLYVVDKDNPFK